MFQYHGWVTLHGSPGDEELADQRAAYERVHNEVASLKDGGTLVDLRWINGMPQLHVFGFLNHRAREGQEILDTFARIGRVAPGSYGLLYFRDDEDPRGLRNEFQVLVMRRGQVTQHPDTFLSPCIPAIEDEE
jgi:hypothetical protein